MAKRSSWMGVGVRVTVALGLLGFLAHSLDIERLISLFEDVQLLWIAIAGLIILALRPITALSWKILLRAHGITVSLARLTKIIFVSMFFGQFLPGSVGPDVVRGYYVVKRRGRTGAVALTILIDRIFGVYAMVLVALLGASLSRIWGRPSGLLVWVLLLQIVLLIGWLFASRIIYRLEGAGLFEGTRFFAFWQRLLGAAKSITDLERLRRYFWPVLVVSLIVVLARCAIFYALYRSFGVSVPFDALMIFIPAMFMAVLIPLSISGLGVREATLAYLFHTVGVAPEASVGAGLLFHLLQIIGSLPGVPFWLGERMPVRREAEPVTPDAEPLAAGPQ